MLGCDKKYKYSAVAYYLGNFWTMLHKVLKLSDVYLIYLSFFILTATWLFLVRSLRGIAFIIGLGFSVLCTLQTRICV